MGQGVHRGQGEQDLVLQGLQVLQVLPRPDLPRGAPARPHRIHRGGRFRLHQEEICVPNQVSYFFF